MLYVFYGRIEETQYNPYMANYYGAKVPTLGAWNGLKGWQAFYSKVNVHAEIKKDTKIDINGESIRIADIQYDIENDSYKCYTDKVISRKDGNMTREQAEKKLEEMSNKGFFKRLLEIIW
jgi:predicted secreted Zn-dependent protease